jgi:hypothetical protein
MFTLPSDGGAPRQYCSHVAHDGWRDIPPTRAIWPLYGLEDTVTTYLALLDRAARDILPDLSDLEVD